jgi:hypothetical protein
MLSYIWIVFQNRFAKNIFCEDCYRKYKKFVSNIFLYFKEIVTKNIFMNNKYIWCKYIYGRNISMQIYLWKEYFDANIFMKNIICFYKIVAENITIVG